MHERFPLADGETILWQGRPAPRGYTFRNWRHALFGFALSLPCLFWLLVGIELAAAGSPAWVAWLPLPFALGSLYLAFGQLLIARLEWEKVLYTVSESTICLQRGLFRPKLCTLPRAALVAVRTRRLGPNLATVRFEAEDGRSLTFCAIEHPELLLRHVPDAGGAPPSQPSPAGGGSYFASAED